MSCIDWFENIGEIRIIVKIVEKIFLINHFCILKKIRKFLFNESFNKLIKENMTTPSRYQQKAMMKTTATIQTMAVPLIRQDMIQKLTQVIKKKVEWKTKTMKEMK